MTDRPSQMPTEPLARALTRARLSIFWERIWPAIVALAMVAGLFLAVSWLGIWLWLPPIAHIVALVIFAALAIAALAPLAFVRIPGMNEGLRRLDHLSRLSHRPATTVADSLAATAGDPVSQALWRAHVERALAAARSLKAGWPMPQLARRDPYALRALVLVLVAATFVAAGGERYKRIAAAFDWDSVGLPANFRVDAWVTPPPYTGRAPVILPGLHPGEPARAAGTIAVPVGSTLVIRWSGSPHIDVAITGGLIATDNNTPATAPSGSAEHRYIIKDTGTASLHGADNVSWSFTAIPDKPPKIALAKDPEPQVRGALLLAYKLEDDYGVTEAHATFVPKPAETENGIDKKGRTAHPLYDAPDILLALPQVRTRNGIGQTTKDLTENPWAGVDVTMTLVARDEGGNEGKSEPYDFQLPQRPFYKPLARSLIEQRRNLALDANAKPLVLTALDALTIAPERFIPEAGVYLGLRSIYYRLAHAKNDDDLRDVVKRLWEMAVQIEDGNVADTEAALRAAQDRLREALEHGATDEEIKRLTDELRAALDKFLQALAEEMRKNGQQLARPLDPNVRQIRPQDLQNMIDRLEQLARSGAKDAARQLLQQLQSMLENLQMARPNASPGGDLDDDTMAMLNELGDMIRKQQQLRDRTFQQGQEGRRQQGQQGQKSLEELRKDQQALKERLNRMLQELKKRGLGQQNGQQGQSPNGDMDQLGEAGEAMGEAEGELGEGNADSAVGSQGRALEALRKGAQGLAQALQQGDGTGPGPGQPGPYGRQRAQQQTDPLGRPLRGRDYGDDLTVKVPGEIDVQRARRILEELRRRYGESQRPQLELDYLERLLKDF